MTYYDEVLLGFPKSERLLSRARLAPIQQRLVRREVLLRHRQRPVEKFHWS